MRRTLEVTGRPLTYATRRLKPGDSFVASDRDARILIRMKRARENRETAVIPPPPPELSAKFAKFDADGDGSPGGCKAPDHTEELKALRAAYFAKFNKRPFMGWNAESLAAKIAEA